MNQINVIFPYLKNSTWVFDDVAKDLKQEPFVQGIPAIINYYVKKAKNFTLFFSKSAFPESNVKLKKMRNEFGGAWYKDLNTGSQGWLCPALFKYFDKAPSTIYIKIEV